MKASKTNRALSLLLSLTMCAMLVPAPAFATDGDTTGSTGTSTETTQSSSKTSGAVAWEIRDDGSFVSGMAKLQSLINSLNAGTSARKVQLVADVTEDITVPESMTLTIDLNGHKITNASGHTITNNGTLTITDSSENKTGTIDNVTHGKAPVENNQGATCTIEKAIITRSKEAGASKEDSGGNSYYYIENFGTMTIGVEKDVDSNVVVGSEGHFSSLVHNGWYDGTKNTSNVDAAMTINAGSFQGGINTIKNDDYGTMTINGGTFLNATQYALQNWNVATINGGSFESTESSAVFTGAGNDTMDKGVTTIKGGEFKSVGDSDIALDSKTTPTVTVYGGTFSKDPNSYLAKNYAIARDADGNYVAGTFVGHAKVGDTEYTTLQTAIDKANEGDTVQLTWNTYENVTVNKSLTLDLNNYTLSGEQVAGKAALTVTSGNVTILDSTNGNGTIKRTDTEANTGVSSHYVIDIQNDANVTIKSGKFTNGSGKLESADKRTGASVIRVGNDDNPQYNPTLTIEGGTFTQDNFVVLKNDCGTLNIKGGTVTCTNDEAVKNYRDTVISGGTINGVASSWAYNGSKFDSELVIKDDAQINGDVYAMNHKGTATKSAKVSIKGGTITGELGIYKGSCIQDKAELTDSDLMSIEVTGGTFKNDPSKYLADGYTVLHDSELYTIASKAETTNGSAAGSATASGVAVENGDAIASEALKAAEAVKDLSVQSAGTGKIGDTNVSVTDDQAKAMKQVVAAAKADDCAKVDVDFMITANMGGAVDDAIKNNSLATTTGTEILPFDLSVNMVTTVKDANGETTAAATATVVETKTPITVTIKVDPSKIADKRVSIARNHNGTVTVFGADSVDYETGEITFKTNQFSKYAVFARDSSSPYDLSEFTDTDGNRTSVPTSSDSNKVFAGWYQDGDFKKPWSENDKSGTAFAKFVDINDLITFKGGSLRMDQGDAATSTSLRFGYTISVPDNCTFVENGWNWSVTGGKSGKKVATDRQLNTDGTATSNIVFTPIGKANYNAQLNVRAYITYKTKDGTTVTAQEANTQSKTVNEVATAIVNHPMAGTNEKTYAQTILDAQK